MSRLLDSPLPIVAAPMAGGPTTAALAIAVRNAGGFPFLAAGYKSVEAFAAEVAEVRDGGGSFGVNLFVPAPASISLEKYSVYAKALRAEAELHGAELPIEPHWDDDFWHDKIDFLVSEPVPAVSFTFGLPSADVIARLKGVGTQVIASVTTVSEARAAAEARVDGIVVQGASAGGHSATFDPDREIEEVSTGDLVAAVRTECSLPLIAAGGVDGAETVASLLAGGADSVAVGTLLLRVDEAGTSDAHRAALEDPAYSETVLTRAFTGRLARGLRNEFIDLYSEIAPSGYPEIHHLTRPLRQAATRAGDPTRMHLWAGTGYRSARTGPAADLITSLVTHL